MTLSVQEWLEAGKPKNTPFVLVRESKELPSPPSTEAVELEVTVLTALILHYAEHEGGDGGYTICPPRTFPCEGSYWKIQDGDVSFLLTYDLARNVVVAGAEICVFETEE